MTLISPIEAAKRLGKTRQRIYQMIGNKQISHQRVWITKERIQIEESEIDRIKAIEQSKVKSQTANLPITN